MLQGSLEIITNKKYCLATPFDEPSTSLQSHIKITSGLEEKTLDLLCTPILDVAKCETYIKDDDT